MRGAKAHLPPALLICGVIMLSISACASHPSRPRPHRAASYRQTQSPEPALSPAPVVLSTEPWSFGVVPGSVIRTAHYRIYTTETDQALVSRLPGFLEIALEHNRTALGPLPAPPIKLDTYLMDSRPQWKRLTLRLLGKRGEQFLSIQRGGFSTQGFAVLYDIGPFDTLAIAAHEGWHQYAQRTFQQQLPIWLEEGIASYMEGHKWRGQTPVFLPWANIERFDELRSAAANGALLSLPELLTRSPQDGLNVANKAALSYYAQVWALVHFLHEGDNRAVLRALISDAVDGRLGRRLTIHLGADRAAAAMRTRRGDDVFRVYFGDDLASVTRDYDAYINRLVRAGSRQAIVAGRSPFTSQGAGAP